MATSLVENHAQTALSGEPGTGVIARLTASHLAAALEVLAVFAACQAFLWKYSPRYPRGWLVILLFLVISLAVRRPRPGKLGLTVDHGWEAMRWMLPGVFLPTAVLLLYGARTGQVGLLLPDWLALAQFFHYLCWCVLQQFALQSYLHTRLLDAVPNPHFTSAMIGLIFGSMHLPNPVLTIATVAGGFIMGEIFARYRNLWVLAIGQALVSTAIFVSLPDAWHHRLRVGPGYYWWEIPHH